MPSTRPLPTMLTLTVVLAAGVISGCAGKAPPPPPAAARLISHAGSPLGEIVLTPLGAQRIGVVTTPALRPPASPAPPRAARVLVPASAIVYDPTGRTLLFTSPAPLRYVQQVVDVERFEGAHALLSRGPLPGAAVVSVGAEELFGVQSGVLAQT